MALSAVQLGQLSRLLDEALTLDATSRLNWLEQVCPRNRELATVLRGCLLPPSNDEPGSMDLETLPRFGRQPNDQAASHSVLRPDERAGPYRLVRRLGGGGMAEVWLAQRADGAFQREVALKVPALFPLRPDLVRRFARECEILAGLEHPNIARMYDAGVRPDGLQYLVMEYVPGEALIDGCDARCLGLAERIRLFLQVLDAVQYAHERGVIHRDLKPSNILVREDGDVRLLDFGIASFRHEEDVPCSQITRVYGRALTPAYASLELLRGEPGDAASDVYALGVVLYELLSGNRPYRIKPDASVRQLEEAVAVARIERPSAQLALKAGLARGTTQRELARQLSGNLDEIVLKALSPAREDRYPTASELADDLRRHVRGESMRGMPSRRIRRADRLLRKHWIGAAAATLAVLSGVVAVVCTIATSSLPHSLAPDPAPTRIASGADSPPKSGGVGKSGGRWRVTLQWARPDDGAGHGASAQVGGADAPVPDAGDSIPKKY